jgi:hypothetical protein
MSDDDDDDVVTAVAVQCPCHTKPVGEHFLHERCIRSGYLLTSWYE